MEIKTDIWTASIVDLSYPLVLSCFWRLDVPTVVSATSVWAGGCPGMERSGASLKGNCGSEDWDEFARSLIREVPSTVIAVGPEHWPVDGSVMDVGMGGIWDLIGSLTYVTVMG